MPHPNHGHPNPPPPEEVTLDRSILEKFLERAAAAARIADHLDAPAVEPLADHVYALVHGLTELLGAPAARVPRAHQATIETSLAVHTTIAHELGAVLGPHAKVMVVPSACSTFALAVVRRDDVDRQEEDNDNDEPTEIRPCPALPPRKQFAGGDQ